MIFFEKSMELKFFKHLKQVKLKVLRVWMRSLLLNDQVIHIGAHIIFQSNAFVNCLSCTHPLLKLYREERICGKEKEATDILFEMHWYEFVFCVHLWELFWDSHLNYHRHFGKKKKILWMHSTYNNKTTTLRNDI